MSSAKSIDICPLISRATLDTMLRCTLSSYGNIQEERESNQYLQSVNRLTDLVNRRIFNPLHYLDFIYFRSKEGKEFRQLADYVHSFSSKIIEERRQQLEEDPSTLKRKHQLDFVDILLTAKDEDGEGLTIEEIRDEVDTFLFEGHDTTASALMWTLYSLAKYPEEQAKVRSEVQGVLSGRQMIEYDDIPKLEYLSCFLKESMRVYSPVPAISRTTVEDCVIDGVTFPPGTTLDVYICALNHNPDVWPDYNVFRPERFLQQNISDKDPFAYLPFSGGSRNCIGQVFAKNEMKVLISKILTRFQITEDRDKEPVPYPSLVMRAKDGIYLSFLPLH